MNERSVARVLGADRECDSVTVVIVMCDTVSERSAGTRLSGSMLSNCGRELRDCGVYI